jgi:hypothetical protein
MKLTSGYDRNFLRHMETQWMTFYHGANKDAIRLHSQGWLERRHLTRREGGYEYRVTDAARAALEASP